MTRILLVNGPPRSGKDTVGDIVKELVPDALVTKFAHSLKCATHALYCALHGNQRPIFWDSATNDAFYEQRKSEALPRFYGRTPRECYIAVSELLLKKVHGESFFGELLAARIANSGAKFAVVTDSGFLPEALALIDEFGPENVAVVKLRRKGCDFTGDSRGYIRLPNPNSNFRLENDNDIPALRKRVRDLLLPAIWPQCTSQ